MKLNSEVKKLIKSLVHELSIGNYSIARKSPFSSRCDTEGISQALEDYGRAIVDLPDLELDEVNAIPIEGIDRSMLLILIFGLRMGKVT